MQQLGSARFFSGQWGECNLKYVVKKPGRNTGKKARKFTPHLSQRHAEQKALQYAMTKVEEKMNGDGFTY